MATSKTQTTVQPAPITTSKTDAEHRSSETMTPTAFYATKAFGYTRIALGAASVLSPKFTCSLFQFLISNETALVVRMFGVRGVALGWTILQNSDKEVKGALRANIGCDLVDLCCLALAVQSHGIDKIPGGILAMGAAFCAGLGFLGLSTL